MSELIFAAQQGRKIPKEDKIFAISNRAKATIAKEGRENVINATVGALMDDEGKLIVLSSVTDVFKSLAPAEFAEYAPIAGTPGFREAVKKDALGGYTPKRIAEAVVTPGGTGSIRNTVANYSDRGDKILTADWHWSPYNTIAGELGRSVITFRFFNEERGFDVKDFAEKVEALLAVQERLVVILNTPAHNPTGYALSVEDWKQVAAVLNGAPKDKKITLLVDAAYIDFAGESEECRAFLPIIDAMDDNIMPIIAHSLSKGYTLYGMRCGAMVCMAPTREIADEFKSVCEYSCRASWSNCNRAPQVILTKIYEDPALLEKVQKERAEYREMLLRRGKAFEEAAAQVGLVTVPFVAGFFVSVPCDDPDAVSAKLEEENIFTIPLAKGVRVSVAAVGEERCRILPAKIKAALEAVQG